ncbi:putative ABC transporter ATP-binding protein YxlF [Phycisphaerae bacterium RAS1]|nr:putative ABC transporter ATP-binding protein YxlF [Phycisphaerae bacterium RAS1]
MTATMQNILGPRVPTEELRSNRMRYVLPSVLLVIAGALVGVSFFFPYWKMKLIAPQYPKGLHVQAYLNRLEGDVHEIDGLNHYIGMRPLNDAAQLERNNSAMLIVVLAALLVAGIFIHSRWAGVIALPAVLFPVGFLVDLQYWLATFGTNLDPHAALSSSIKPFVPPVLGVGTIGQFKTVADPSTGLWLATIAALVVITALYFHRRAYKPLVDAQRAARNAMSPMVTVALVAVALLAPGTASAQEHSDKPRVESAVTAVSPVAQLIRAAVEGGDVRVPAGTYRGTVLIDKPVRLIADGDVTLDAGGEGDVVRITAPDVTLRGFRIRNTGESLDEQNAGVAVLAPRATVEHNTLTDVLVGILLNTASDATVRNNSVHGKNLYLPRRGDGIRLWNSNNCIVEDNKVEAVRDVVIWYSRGAQLRRNTVQDSRYGMHFMYAHDGVLEENRLVDNSVGVFLMYSGNVVMRRNLLDHNRGPSGYGIGLKDMDGLIAEENALLANRVGMYMDNSPSRIDVEHHIRRNVFAYNDIALAFLPAVQRNHFSENEFRENIEQVALWGTGELKNNKFTVDGVGNYWSDYAGFDAAGDGVGDLPYHATGLFENLMDREPKFRLFIYSPAQQAIELASKAFPIMQPAPKITDTAPLTRPIALHVQPARAAAAWPMPTVSAGLLAVVALVLRPWTGRWGRGAQGAGRGRVARSSARLAETQVCEQRSERPLGRAAVATMDNELTKHVQASPAPRFDPSAPVSSAPPILRIEKLTKRFGRNTAVDQLSLDVQPGAAVALWGTNGAGKTTIIKCLLGLHSFRGCVRIGNFDVRRDGKAARRLVGYVSQELAFYDELTTTDTLRFFARLKGCDASTASVHAALARVGLIEHAAKRVGELSGGMKQRLALAVALLADPPLLLLDEPTSNLDARARRQFLELLRGLKESGKTVVYSTHRAEEVSFLADRLVMLERGRVVQDGPPALLNQLAAAVTFVRIPLTESLREQACGALTRAGFDASLNHTAVLVRVPSGRKAGPLAALQAAGIAVEDFELESEENHE